MSMIVVVREALCVYAGSAWLVWDRSLHTVLKKCDGNTKGNEVVAASSTPVSVGQEVMHNSQITKMIML